VAAVRLHIGKHVQADREFDVARVEIRQVVGTPRRNMVQNVLGQVPMRVYEPNAMSQSDMLDDHVPKQGRFAGTSLSDDINVVALVGDEYAEKLGLAPAFALSDNDPLVVQWSFKVPIPTAIPFRAKPPMSKRLWVKIDLFHRQKRLGRADGVIAAGVEI
jgi:hypothetical protein